MYIKSTEFTLTPHLIPGYDGFNAHVSKTNTQNFQKNSMEYKSAKNIVLSYKCDPVKSSEPYITSGGVVNNINIDSNKYNNIKN